MLLVKYLYFLKYVVAEIQLKFIFSILRNEYNYRDNNSYKKLRFYNPL